MSTTKGRPRTKAKTIRAATNTTVAGLYLRISHDPSGQKAGVDRQRDYGMLKAQELGVTVPAWAIYEDNDKSATNGKVRDGFERMLADLESGRITVVIAYHPDRLYRRVQDLERLIDIVEGRGDVMVATVTAGDINLNNPSGRLIARLLGAVARAEVEYKTGRWLDALQQHREKGDVPGSGPRMYGWQRKGDPVPGLADGAIVPHEAEVIRELARRVIDGEGITGLCVDLNARGIRTSGGNEWRATSMRKLLRNPRLAGYSVLRGEIVYTKDGKPARGKWEPILDHETWELLTALLASRSRVRPPRVGLLPGLLYCGRCKVGRMVSSRRTDGRRIYRCPKAPGLQGCGRISGDAEPIEAWVLDFARERLDNPKVREHLARERKAGAKGSREIIDKIETLRAKVPKLEAEIEDPTTKARTIPSLRRSLDRTFDLLDELEAQLEATAQRPVELPEVGEAWPDDDSYDLATRRRLVELVVRRVELMPAPGGRFRTERVEIDGVPMD